MSVPLTRSRLLLTVLLVLLLVPPPAAAYFGNPGSVPLRRSLPNGIDLMESGLYWMQDMTSADDLRDPASIVGLMEDQAARFFDFAYMAYLIGGPGYTRLDVLERSHFQNRVRDRLFKALAHKVGMYNRRMPRFRPLLPVATSSYTWQAGGVFYHPGGPVLSVYFHFYLTPRGWRIYDVSSNGVSAVNDLRKRFFANRFEP
jgi:ABC-type transporter MlaC component